MTNLSSIILGVNKQTLNPNQKKYFKLLEDIEHLKKEKEDRFAFYLGMVDKFHDHILPIQKNNALLFKKLAINLDKCSQKFKFSRQVNYQVEELIPFFVEKYKEHFPEDEEIKSLLAKWHIEPKFNQAIENDFQKFIFKAAFKNKYDIDIDEEDVAMDLNNPENAKEFFAKYSEKIKEKETENKNKWESRKKTKKELQHEETEKKDNRNIREIYIGLAKILHPDKATSQEELARNEEVMKLVAQAYENKDIVALISLECQYLQYTENEILNIETKKIKSLINALTEQKKQLATEVERVTDHPSFNTIRDFIPFNSTNLSLAIFDQNFVDLKNNNAFLRDYGKILSTVPNKKFFLPLFNNLYEQFAGTFEYEYPLAIDMDDEIAVDEDDFTIDFDFAPKRKKKKQK